MEELKTQREERSARLENQGVPQARAGAVVARAREAEWKSELVRRGGLILRGGR